ncbi:MULTISPECIES: hypothetical protein [unclassified Serratia (in: enterobacteria)]|uniref:hypothetical protein n=1 Tax=unclassified Serratia (in: enterobacteria) TaxID=2647522 RepID=UPI0030766B4B
MDESLDELSVKLNGYINNLKKENCDDGRANNFPNKNKLKSNNKTQIKIIIEQGEKLLSLNPNSILFGLSPHPKDKAILIEHFLSDLEQFATTKGIHLGGKHILTYAQSKIPEHAFFHLAASPLLPSTYETIEQHAGQVFNIYSIPFKIRISLESKIKSIIGFKNLEIKKWQGGTIKSYDLPFSYVVKELMHIKCLNLPCSLENILNIYQWSCDFCHTGEKEPIWLSMKALEIISSLFVYQAQKKHEIDITELWHKYVISEEYLLKKLINYKGFVRPLYLFKKNWSIQKLQSHLNTPEDEKRKYRRKDAEEVTFNLSETEFSEVSFYWCGRTKEYY